MEVHLDNAFERENNSQEAQSFAAIFRNYYSSLCYFAEKILQDSSDSKDIVAAVFERIWQKQIHISADNIKALLYTSVRNDCLKLIRTKKYLSKEQKQLEYILTDEDEFQTQVMENELLRDIYREIESLPEECRRIFKLLYCDNKTTRQVAIALGLAESTVRNQKTRAVALLRKKIFPDDLFAAAVVVGTAAAVLSLIVLLIAYVTGMF